VTFQATYALINVNLPSTCREFHFDRRGDLSRANGCGMVPILKCGQLPDPDLLKPVERRAFFSYKRAHVSLCDDSKG
jgi:hypothetical protein